MNNQVVTNRTYHKFNCDDGRSWTVAVEYGTNPSQQRSATVYIIDPAGRTVSRYPIDPSGFDRIAAAVHLASSKVSSHE